MANKKQIETLQNMRKKKMEVVGSKSATMADSLPNNLCAKGYTLRNSLKILRPSQLFTSICDSSMTDSTIGVGISVSKCLINKDTEVVNKPSIEINCNGSVGEDISASEASVAMYACPEMALSVSNLVHAC